MKKRWKWIALLCVILLLLTACKGRTVVESSDAVATTEQMLYSAPLVILGKVTAQKEGHYRNPDLSKKAPDGNPFYNTWITPYTVEILEVYKGNLKDDITTLDISISNDYSPQVMQEENIDAPYYTLQVGDTFVFCLTYIKTDELYGPLLGGNGCFVPTEQQNVYFNGHDTIDISKMDELLASAEQKKNRVLPEAEFYIRPEDQAA